MKQTATKQFNKIMTQKELFVMGCRRPVSTDNSFCVVIIKKEGGIYEK